MLPLRAFRRLDTKCLDADRDESHRQEPRRSSRQPPKLAVEDHGDSWAYVDYACANCAGKQSDGLMCWIHVGVIQEAVRWQTGREAGVVQTACRAQGAEACVWEVSKTPKE